MPRAALLTAALLAATSATAAAQLVTPASAAAGPSVSVHGRLVVIPSDRPHGHTAYAVALSDGDLVPIRGDLDPRARTGDVFSGRLAVPAGVVHTLAARGESGATSALELVDRRSLTLRIVGSPSVIDVSAAVTPTTHTQYVAALDNKGALTQTDSQLLAHVTNVGTYWKNQSNGAISGITVPATVTHYNTSVSTSSCGLGSGGAEFSNLIQEAMAKFPGINPFGGTDQLVLFVPPDCYTGSTVGRGTVGSSFASGGALIAESSSSIEGVYAHETGHNYGFQHANARWSGSSMEYYGIYDVMGFALPAQYNMLTALSTPYRVFQGITDSGEIQDVDLGNGASPVHATAVIKPRSDTSGLRSVRVKDPDTGETLYLDFRAGTGQDASAAYASYVGLNSGNGNVWYAPGVTVEAARTVNGAPSGVDTLVLDAGGDTSLGSGASWSDASGELTVTVTSLTLTGASVSVDYAPPQDFTTVGTPVIGGSVAVGGTVTLDTGSWVPSPTTTQVRWTADGQAVAALNDKTSFTAGPDLVGKQLVATVTAKKQGYNTASAQSAGTTVQAGTIPTSASPTITGTAHVGFTLHAQTGTWGTVLSTVTSSYQWQRDGTDIPGATGADYDVVSDDVGSALSVVQSLAATGYQKATLTSSATETVPLPVIDPAPTPTITGTPQVGVPLQVSTGTWMVGTDLGFQWFVAGAPVGGATGTSYTPTADDLGKTVHVEVTGTMAGYPTVTKASAESGAVSMGVLTSAVPAIGGKPKVGKTLKAKPGAWSPGTSFSFAWYANGTKIKHQKAATLTLTKAQRGTRITVKVTGTLPGYTTVSRTSAKTAKVR